MYTIEKLYQTISSNGQKLTDEVKEILKSEIVKKKMDQVVPMNNQQVKVGVLLSEVGNKVNDLNKHQLNEFNHLLSLGHSIIALESFFGTQNSNKWGTIKKSFGFGEDKLSRTSYNNARYTVLLWSYVKDYFGTFGVDVETLTNSALRDKKKLKAHVDKYGTKLEVKPYIVIKIIKGYLLAKRKSEYARIFGKLPKDKKVETKKPQIKEIKFGNHKVPTIKIDKALKSTQGISFAKSLGIPIEELRAKIMLIA